MIPELCYFFFCTTIFNLLFSVGTPSLRLFSKGMVPPRTIYCYFFLPFPSPSLLTERFLSFQLLLVLYDKGDLFILLSYMLAEEFSVFQRFSFLTVLRVFPLLFPFSPHIFVVPHLSYSAFEFRPSVVRTFYVILHAFPCAPPYFPPTSSCIQAVRNSTAFAFLFDSV